MTQNHVDTLFSRVNYGTQIGHNDGTVTNNFYPQENSRQQVRRCHQLFKTTEYEAFKNLNSHCHPNTCEWTLQHPQFLEWQTNSRDSLLWITADPGCGKSVLSRHLVDSGILEEPQSSVCYFFFRDNSEQNNLAAALCAVLHQLFGKQPHLLHHAVLSWEKNGNRVQHEPGELWRILCTAAADPAIRPVVCILDALDECVEQDCHQLVKMLCHFYTPSSLSKLSKSSSSTLKFLVTSRPNDRIERSFQYSLSAEAYFRLRGEDESDQIRKEVELIIEKFVDEIAEEFKLSQKSHESLRRGLLQIEYRTYLGLHLVLDQIRETYENSICPDEAQIVCLPPSVEAAYEQILSTITMAQKEIVQTILLMMLAARQPLTVEAVSAALTLTFSKLPASTDLKINVCHVKKQIRRWCGYFIVVSKSRLYFIHKTVTEFLMCPDDMDGPEQQAMASTTWKHSISNTNAHKKLAIICQKALVAFHGTHPKTHKGSLVHYASEHGAYHKIEALRRMLYHQKVFFVHHLDSFGMDLQACDPTGKSLLHHMTDLYNLSIDHKSIEFILTRGGLVQSADSDNMNCLQYAVLRNDTGLLDILLKAGFMVNKPVKRSMKYTPISMNSSTKINTDSGGELVGLTALHAAARFGRARSVSRLLQQKAKVDIVDQYGQTALHLAVGSIKQDRRQMGDMWEESEQMLGHVWNFDDHELTRQIDENEYKSQTYIVSTLCEKAPFLVNIRDIDGRTALHVVSYSRHAEVTLATVKTLLDYGADPRARDNDGIIPIHQAARHANLDCLDLLVKESKDFSKDFSIMDNHGRTTLHYAALSGCHHTVAFILDRISSGDLLESTDCHGQDALQIALYDKASHRIGCYEEVVEILLKAGARANRTNPCGQDALAHYISNTPPFLRSEIVVMLLENGTDPLYRDAEGRNLIHLLVSGNDEADLTAIVALESRGMRSWELDFKGRSVLHHAAMAGSVTRDLLYHLSHCVGLNFDLRDVCHKTAMEYAQEKQRKKHSPYIVRGGRWSETVACFRDTAGTKAPLLCHSTSSLDCSI